MSDEKEKGGRTDTSKPADPAKAASDNPAAGDRTDRRGKKDIGHALRSVYSRAVNEDVPPELLDLLRKLD